MSSLHATVTSKGQVTLPRRIRDQLSIRKGDRLEFSVDEADVLLVRRQRDPGSSAGCGRRFMKPGVGVVTVEAMDAAIRSTAAARHRGGGGPA